MAALGDDRISTDEQLARASTKGDPAYEAVETLLKGPEISGTFTAADGSPYSALPEVEVAQECVYDGQVPVFYGHYWRQGSPRRLHDWTDYAACVDFGTVKGGALTAYRWSGATRIDPAHYVWVGSSAG